MFQLIGIILGLIIVIAIVKVVGGFFLKIVKGILSFIIGLIYLIFVGPALICSVVFNSVFKFLHLRKPAYFLLGLCSIPSFVYMCKIHLPYSKKERFIKSKEFSEPKREERYHTLAMSCFLSLEGLLLGFLPFMMVLEEEDSFFLYGFIFSMIGLIYTCKKIKEWKNQYALTYEKCIEWRKWTLQSSVEISESRLEDWLRVQSEVYAGNDTNIKAFTGSEIPYGRATAFISYFGRNLDDEEPVYFSPKMSSDENELREYGLLVTTQGIYISTPEKKDEEIPFTGLWNISKTEKSTIFDYGLVDGQRKVVEINNNDTSLNMNCILQQKMMFEGLGLSLYHNNLKTELDEAFEAYQQKVVNDSQNHFDGRMNVNDVAKAAGLGGLGMSLSKNAAVYDNLKNNMDGKQGHGVAAEYANNVIDSLNPFNNAQHVGSDNAKHGADRIVNGVNIQTKYKETANASIAAAFEDGKAIYLNEDGSMMQIEVPRDQYAKAVELMKKRIENGEVPGETNPENAKNFVRKGRITYLQAYNVAGSGSIESITIDAAQGILCSIPGAGITTIITFAAAVWNGEDVKEAAKVSTLAGLKVLGRGAAIYTLTMQLSRGKVVNPFYSILKSAGNESVKKYTTNYIAKGANKVAKTIRSSSLANTKVGQKIGLDKTTGKQVISGTITAVVVYGPDIGKALQGKISGKQLIKNSTVNTAGLVGAALGAAIPIPFVGSMIGGSLASFVAKKVMDNFIEDDAVIMYRIIREEFLDIVMLQPFVKEEFDQIVGATIGNPDMPSILQSMYQSGTPKEYADVIINGAVQGILSNRQKITEDDIENGMIQLEQDNSAA